jgi:hypothetical protein
LFDELERVFLDLGARSMHLFFHSSEGLSRFGAKAGILEDAWCRSRKRQFQSFFFFVFVVYFHG